MTDDHRPHRNRDAVTNETLAAILERVETDVRDSKKELREIKDQVNRLDSDVRAGFARREELRNFVSFERYRWVEAVVIGMVAMILAGSLGLLGRAIIDGNFR